MSSSSCGNDAIVARYPDCFEHGWVILKIEGVYEILGFQRPHISIQKTRIHIRGSDSISGLTYYLDQDQKISGSGLEILLYELDPKYIDQIIIKYVDQD